LGDPFFVWQAVLTEDDYAVLRRDQNLVIDFSHFPYKMAELLDKCRKCSQEERPSFYALLNTTQDDVQGRMAMLMIVETTTFRQITHIALKLAPINEQTLRQHLMGIIHQYKEQVTGLKSQLSETLRFSSSLPQQQAYKPFPADIPVNQAYRQQAPEYRPEFGQGSAFKVHIPSYMNIN
jgi:SAS-6-like protein